MPNTVCVWPRHSITGIIVMHMLIKVKELFKLETFIITVEHIRISNSLNLIQEKITF